METKNCTKCGELKSLDDYAFLDKKNNIKKWCCKECDKKVRREYYINNKARIIDKVIANTKQIKLRNQIYVLNYLKEHPCVDCGETDQMVLEFDHRDGVDKINTISALLMNNNCIAKIQAEIDKCDVRCANCHKRRTAKQFGWYKYTLIV